MLNANMTGNYNLDANDATPKHNLGALVGNNQGQYFRYVKYLDGETAVTAAAGVGVFPIKENRWHVTSDYNATTTNCNTIVGKHKGYLQAAITDGYCGWIQTKGPNNKAMTLATATTADSALIYAVTNGNGTVDAIAETTADTNTRHLRTGRIERDITTATTTVAIGHCIIDCDDVL